MMNEATPSLARRLGLFTTTSIIVGAVIGSGIFKKPATMAAELGSPEILLLVWLVAGIITLFGALTNAEVAGMISETGGQYVFFQSMYGDVVAYLYGWAVFIVIQTGSIAAITYVFAEYSQFFFTLPQLSADVVEYGKVTLPLLGTLSLLDNFGVKVLTAGVIAGLTAINYAGLVFGGAVQNIFTVLKVAALMLLVGAGFLWSGGSWGNLTADSAVIQPASGSMFVAFFAALSGAFWAYDGWNNITYIAGEVKDPQRTIPRGLLLGTLLIIACYGVINAAYLYVLPIDAMAASSLVAADAAQAVFGSWGGAFVSAAVMISTFGTSNGTIMASARVYFAMARQKMFFPSVGAVHPRFHTPGRALAIQAGWSSLLVFTGTFDMLSDMLIFVSWLFYALGAFGVFILRKKMPDVHRPYKVWGYPFVPAIFVIFAGVYVVTTAYNDVASFARGDTPFINSAFGLLLVLSGLPLYYYFRRK